MRHHIEHKETNMNAQQLHHQSVPNKFLYSAEPQDFEELHLSKHATHDALDWEELESEYAEESLPGHVLAFFKEAAWG